MLQLLETGRALYVLAAICGLGILTRLITRNLYKRLIKESTNLATTKNKSLRELKQRAENAYRMNQGMRDSGSWLEHQLCELRFRGMTLTGWANFSMQLTWLCLLVGGTGAFLAYWYRMDTYYIVLYGGGAVLMAMLTMLFDGGAAVGREQLTASLQDYLENVLCPRLARSMPDDNVRGENAEQVRAKGRGAGRLIGRGDRNRQTEMEPAAECDNMDQDEGFRTAAGGGNPGGGRNGARGASGPGTGGGNSAYGKRAGRNGRQAAAAAEGDEEPENLRGHDADYLKRSLEQIAASREKNRGLDENWLKELKPEELQLISDILKQYFV